jgi:Flp pilus assembly protein TadG
VKAKKQKRCLHEIRPVQGLLKDQQGATAIVVAIVILLLLGFAALAIDIGHLCVAKAELQNAADAGALAGARFLYNSDGTQVNTGANQIAYDAATANKSENLPVEVNWSGNNGGDVQRGHWSFATESFTPNDSTAPVDLWNVSTDDLDGDPNFINAVRVFTRRQGTPIASYFARLLGHESFQMDAEAIAYVGFAGTLQPYDVEQPIAICADSIVTPDGDYSCNVGRMINSGQDTTSGETGGWTSYNQEDACTGGTNAQEVKNLVCGGGNPEPMTLGVATATNGGEIQSAFNQLIQCWAGETGKTQPWNMTLPVVSCPNNNVGTCEGLKGAVNVNVVWITEAGEDPGYNNAPTEMAGVGDEYGSWSSSSSDGQVRWNSFVTHFNLKNVDGSAAPYQKKAIYFLPDCTPHEPAGTTGGENFGVLAKIPVLVK